MDELVVLIVVGRIEGQDDVHEENDVDRHVHELPCRVVVVDESYSHWKHEASEDQDKRYDDIPVVLEGILGIDHAVLLPPVGAVRTLLLLLALHFFFLDLDVLIVDSQLRFKGLFIEELFLDQTPETSGALPVFLANNIARAFSFELVGLLYHLDLILEARHGICFPWLELLRVSEELDLIRRHFDWLLQSINFILHILGHEALVLIP